MPSHPELPLLPVYTVQSQYRQCHAILRSEEVYDIFMSLLLILDSEWVKVCSWQNQRKIRIKVIIIILAENWISGSKMFTRESLSMYFYISRNLLNFEQFSELEPKFNLRLSDRNGNIYRKTRVEVNSIGSIRLELTWAQFLAVFLQLWHSTLCIFVVQIWYALTQWIIYKIMKWLWL